METTRPLSDEELAMQLAERFGAAATIDLASAPSAEQLQGKDSSSAWKPTACMLEFPAGLELRDGFDTVVRVARVPFRVAPSLLQQQFDRYPESKYPQQQLSFGDAGTARPVLSAAAGRCWGIIRAAEEWAFIESQHRSETSPADESTSEPAPAAGGQSAPSKRRRSKLDPQVDLETHE